MKTILLAFALVIPSVGWSQNLEFYQRAQIQNQLAYQSQILTEINNRHRREDMAIQNEEMASWRAQKNGNTQNVESQGAMVAFLAEMIRRRDAAQQELETFRQSQSRAATLNGGEKTQSPAASGR